MGPLARAFEHLDVSAPHEGLGQHSKAHRSHEEPLEAWLLSSSSSKGHARFFRAQDHTSFLFGKKSAGVETADEAKKIHDANQDSIGGLKAIKKWDAKMAEARVALDKAMGARHAAMRPVCLEYMKHRAQLMGLAGAQCQAAQGRVNAEDLTVIQGPRGCVAPDMSGSTETEPGTPLTLHEERCSHGIRKLLCSERIAELERGDGAPGEEMLRAIKHEKPEPGSEEHMHKHVEEAKEGEGAPANSADTGPNSAAGEKGEPEPEEEDQPHADSMDAEFRKWCRPAFRLNVQPISESLSRAVLAPTVEDEVSASES